MTLRPRPAVAAATLALLALLGTVLSGVETAGGEVQPAPDLALDLIARDPLIAQPVFLNFDERGRIWVVLYRQYPEPAGLTPRARDSVWRIQYDRKKPPPPYDTPEKAPFRGRDRILILEDVRRDGSFSKATTFIEGLNLTTAVCRGRGGVWVLSPPQLLWYPDANDDDIPDGPPVVALDGFGIEDTHSIANSLRWGPDGWLYGAVGSTVSSDIVRPDLDATPVARIVGQAIWRYHPGTRQFEVFAEGGGNAFGCEIDAKGRVFSGHNGGDTRGFHYVQGGYHRKGFDKHGELSNPYAFGFFPAMPHNKVQRYSHNFIRYEGAALPERYRGRLIAIDPMSNWLPVAEITPRGASFETRDTEAAVRSTDKLFRPVDIKHGPDGAIYLADWRDFQINHYRNHEGQITPEDGRIYRLRARDAKTGLPSFDLRRQTSAELIALLRHENRWWRETARQVLAERRDPSVIPALRAELERNEPGQLALESLWALHLSGGFTEPLAVQLLRHRDPYVRLWSARLVGDAGTASATTARALAELARIEPEVEVRSQLAASARRFPASVALPIVRALLSHDADLSDPYVPLQLWWAIEYAVGRNTAEVLALFGAGGEESLWRHRLVATHIAGRLMQRFASAGGRENFIACARLLEQAPDAASRRELGQGFEKAFAGRALPPLPDVLVQALLRVGGDSLPLRVRQRDPAALAQGLAVMSDPRAPVAERVPVIAAFGEVPHPPAAAALGRLVSDPKVEIVRAALASAASYPSAQLTETMLGRYAQFAPEERALALSVLASRRESARTLVAATVARRLPVESIPAEVRDKLRLVADAPLARQLDELFGATSAGRPESLNPEIDRIVRAVERGVGSVYTGRAIFQQRCAACHRLFNLGGQIGPDLTPFKRTDLPSLVLAIVSPDAEIREGYEPVVVTRADGSVHAGFIAMQDPARVVIRDMAGLSLTIERSAIRSLEGMGKSLMPSGLLAGLEEQPLRDLFAYLRMTQPLVGKE